LAVVSVEVDSVGLVPVQEGGLINQFGQQQILPLEGLRSQEDVDGHLAVEVVVEVFPTVILDVQIGNFLHDSVKEGYLRVLFFQDEGEAGTVL
jgi:hypothetical protein